MKKVRRIRKHPRTKVYRWRKIMFYLSLFLVFVAGVIVLACSLQKPQHIDYPMIRVGICGAIKMPAVYTMREGADISMLIRRAGGLRVDADIMAVNVDKIIKNDSVYHIPSTGVHAYAERRKYMYQVNQRIQALYKGVEKDTALRFEDEDVKVYNILYVGMPSLYVLISYYPKYNRINFIHIPHNSMLLEGKVRLIDIFFSMDLKPTMKLLESELGIHFDYYIIQDRTKFIDMIDRLGGINLKLDPDFAEDYNKEKGINKVDGFIAWEYIRYLDFRNIKINYSKGKGVDLVRIDNFWVSPQTWAQVYEMRNQRQRYVIQGLRTAFKALGRSDQLQVLQQIHTLFETDMQPGFCMSLYKDILSSNSFNFGSIPGCYEYIGRNLYYYPDDSRFRLMRNQEIHRLFDQDREKDVQTIY